MPEFKTATVISHTNPASTFQVVEIETETPLKIIPGQYLSVKVAPDRINAYSVASIINDKRFLLLVDIKPGGPGSKYFASLKEGEQISFLGPFGIFTFKPDDGAQQIIFMATGCGISAIRCLVEEALRVKDQTLIFLLWGLRFNNDIFWKEYFDRLMVENPNFQFKLVLSKPDPSWSGESGHITQILRRDFRDLSNAAIYLCGNQAMITEGKTEAIALNCPKERLYEEKFF